MDDTRGSIEERRIRSTADGDGVAQVRRGITDTARGLGADERTLRRMSLAVSEAVTNAVLHAYPGEPGPVEASIARDRDTIEVMVADDGQGLRTRDDSPGLGMGLGIIAAVAQRLRIEALPGRGTRVFMWFPLRAGETARPAG
jgi:anti-sigma regulatory factor (Ser/Thr protein kinase)